MGESFKPKKFCTAIHRTSVTFHFDWVMFFHDHPWVFGIFCRVFPIISPRLSPIPCAVRGRNKSYHPWLLVTDWGLWFSQKMLETKRFSGEKMKKMFLAHCCYVNFCNIFCIFFLNQSCDFVNLQWTPSLPGKCPSFLRHLDACLIHIVQFSATESIFWVAVTCQTTTTSVRYRHYLWTMVSSFWRSHWSRGADAGLLGHKSLPSNKIAQVQHRVIPPTW